MANGLYSNCRKKPYKGGGVSVPPTIGGFGIKRDYFDTAPASSLVGVPWLTMRGGTLAEIVANTVYCTSSINGDTVDTRDIEASGVGSLGNSYVGTITTTHGVAAIEFTDDVDYTLGAFVAPAASFSRDCIVASVSGTGNTVYIGITGGFSATGATVQAYVDGSLVDTITISSQLGGLNALDLGVLPARKISKLTVVITNNEAFSWTFIPTITSGSDLKVSGFLASNRTTPRNAAVFYAGHFVHDWDACDYAGAMYRTGSVVSAGTGQAYISNVRPYVSLSTVFMTAVATGTHTYEVDELCTTWVT